MKILIFLVGLVILIIRGGWFLLKFLVPHFVTVEVACDLNESGEYIPVLDMDWVKPSDTFDGVATYRFFTWLGFGLLPKAISPLRPWVNPHQGGG